MAAIKKSRKNKVAEPVTPTKHDYAAFLAKKSQLGGNSGFEPTWMPDFLDFGEGDGFQHRLTDWSIRKGRAAMIAACGLGKTPMSLVWAENIRRYTNKPVIVATPLAVSAQTVREANKFGIDAKQSREGTVHPNITVTNYERLHYFDPDKFSGMVLDEAQCVKSFDGKRRKEITRFMSKMPFRLLCSATPAPNDFIELGALSEALGVMTQSDMLSYFFTQNEKMRHSVLKEDDFWNKVKWSFKPHAEVPFWRWVCSWARACGKPSDLGDFDDSRFVLPPLNYFDHVIDVPFIPPGEMFPRPAISLHEGRIERKRTIAERCEKVREIVDSHDRQVIVWCHYNDEGDRLAEIIKGSVQVAGGDSDEEKESRLNDFALGNIRVLVTKPKIGALGLNLQKCGDMTFFPSFSYEQLHQGIARCWRFGRIGDVNVHMVCAEGESGVTSRLKIKQEKSERMFQEVIRHMRAETEIRTEDRHHAKIELPHWL